ncbi:MAG: MFS transporter [Chloroflexi bacterium]|nr:MFS transporter [Chloroflexota bacterium]
MALAALVIANLAETWHLYVFAVMGGVTAGISQPARQAFVYDVTSRELLTNALTVNSLAQNVARVTGPPLAGAIIGWWGTASSFFVLAVFNFIAMGFTMLIQPRARVAAAPGPKTSAVGSMMEGLRYAYGNRLILALLLTTLITPILVIPYVQFLPVFATEVLHGGPETYGLLASGVGWGSLIGLLVLAYLGDVKRKGLVFVIAQLCYAGTVLAFSRTENIYLSMLCLVVTGVVFSVMQVMANTMFQLASSNEMRGRVMALYSMNNGFQPVGSLPMGFAAERWGIANTMSGFMLTAIAAMTAVTVLFPELRRVEISPSSGPVGGKGTEPPAAPAAQPRTTAR